MWIVLGVALLVLTFADTFVTVLNYDEGGILVNRIVRWQWVAMRAATRRVSRRWRPMVLRQVTGVLLLTTILSWLGGMILGFAFIYLGLIESGAFQLSQGVQSNFLGALYLSIGQFSTVGADNISPAGGWVNLVPVLEALTSVAMLSFIITFLSNIYGVIQLLRSLCADFFSTGPGVGSPVDALRPYFPDGEVRDLDRHLFEMIGDFNLYCDSLRQDHAAYHFQSGDDKFSLPFALYMTSGTIGALRWGLPTGHVATKQPNLPRLIEAFDDFLARRYVKMHWPHPVAPAPVDATAFAEAFDRFHAGAVGVAIDPWVARFLALNDEMSEMIGAEPATDGDDAYRRYVEWLPFAYPAVQFVAAVSRDLDYQPIYRGASGSSAGVDDAPTSTGPEESAHGPRRSALMRWVRRRQLFTDPGYVRLWAALRTVGAVAAAVVVAVGISAALGGTPATAGVFAGLLALFSGPMTIGWGTGLKRATGLLALIPLVLGVAAGALLPRDPVIAVVAIAVIAAAAVFVGRFGPVWATLGQVAFIAYYFSLLLAVSPREMLGAIAAASIGVLFSWASNLIPGPSRDRQITAGIAAVRARVAALVDSAVDALSTGAEQRSGRILRADSEALRRTATTLEVALDEASADRRSRSLRLRIFDLELAAGNLVRVLPGRSDDAVTMEQRSHLAGELVAVQERFFSGHAEADARAPRAPKGWPAQARRAHAAVHELALGLAAVSAWERGDSHPAPLDDSAPPDVPGEKPEKAVSTLTRAEARAVDRRTVQAGISTGIALSLGSLVSTTHQFWAAMPAYQTLSASDGETVVKSVQRIVGTVVGAGAAFGLALWTGHDSTIAFAVLTVSVFFISFLRAVASSWTAFWQTVLLATMYDVLGKLTPEAVDVRVIETIIGAVVATIVSAVILPTRTRTRVLAGMEACMTTISAVVHAALSRLADPSPSALTEEQRRAISDEELAMRQRFDAVAVHSVPLRRAPGALQTSGIEAQLTAIEALAYYARRLVANAERRDAASANDAQWKTLDAATSDNFGAVVAVLDGRLPSRVHAVAGLPTLANDGGRSDVVALRDVERINSTLIAYMEAVRPGSTGVTSS